MGVGDEIDTKQLLILHQIGEEYLEALDSNNDALAQAKRTEYKRVYREMMMQMEDYSHLSRKERKEVEKSMDELADMTLDMLEQGVDQSLLESLGGYDEDDEREIDTGDLEYWEEYLQQHGMA